MKNLLTTTLLIFTFGFIIFTSSYAKVLPIIEGSEILDSIASQSSQEHNIPQLSAGIYKYVDSGHMINPQNNFLIKQLYTMDKGFYGYSFMPESVYPILYLKPDNKSIITKQIHTQH